MYLKSISLNNFRKFGIENNTIEFVEKSNKKAETNIDISKLSTLIIGQNNAGKTSIITALNKLINNEPLEITDFNVFYLQECWTDYCQKMKNAKDEEIETPMISFSIVFGMEDNENNKIQNFQDVLLISRIENATPQDTIDEIKVMVKYDIKEKQQFLSGVKELIESLKKNILYEDEIKKIFGKENLKLGDNFQNIELLEKRIVSVSEMNDELQSMLTKIKNQLFQSFFAFLKTQDFKLEYYAENGEPAKNFKLSNVISMKTIKANNITRENCLSSSFNKIIQYKFEEISEKDAGSNSLQEHFDKINQEATKIIDENYTGYINNTIKQIQSPQKLQMFLSSNVTLKNFLSHFVRYEYIDKDFHIPEKQFGLGYTNLMMIIADLVDFIEKYDENDNESKITLIAIEEPETFMHPQMQELFIKHINKAVNSLLERNTKIVNVQLIISTHSAHILNSKVHEANTFNFINYLTTTPESKNTLSVILSDNKISKNIESGKDELKFIKKHIKFKVSELFFADAVIFVEGPTEETLLKYFLEQKEELNKFYITVFNINGAHGSIYRNLVQILKIPTLIITDLDINRVDNKKNKKERSFPQVSDLTNIEFVVSDETSTNKTISDFFGKTISNTVEEYFITTKDNLCLTTQGRIQGYYATSLEEALILTNYKNELFKNSLKLTIPIIYKKIWDNKDDNLKDHSYQLQIKLSDKKTKFSDELLYNMIVSDELITTPSYISKGFDWLHEQLDV